MISPSIVLFAWAYRRVKPQRVDSHWEIVERQNWK
jgi:hypothetical protein